MDIASRTKVLSHLFSYDRRTEIEDSQLEIIPYRFTQTVGASEICRFQRELPSTEFCPVADSDIPENQSFMYTVFSPGGKERRREAIILLHGLNERSWEKYLTWAETLATSTGKPVILFPIAFHMNRTPGTWNNPRETLPWANRRKQEIADLSNSTFANVALSSRISCHPLRFYASGRESAYNLCQLVREIKNGEHPLFEEGTSINLFAYSIGALLSQVVLLATPEGMFDDTKLFMFCGGSIFSEMNGNARDILDKEAFDRLQHYFLNDFLARTDIPPAFKNDDLERAFKAMIEPNVLKEYRESFFKRACNRIRAVSLKHDVVMPTAGIIAALGEASSKILKELDFPFTYSHQIPFPMTGHTDPELIRRAFDRTFGEAAAFL
jgi:pimeloyl-ACP methyl ester carboxylesterase